MGAGGLARPAALTCSCALSVGFLFCKMGPCQFLRRGFWEDRARGGLTGGASRCVSCPGPGEVSLVLPVCPVAEPRALGALAVPSERGAGTVSLPPPTGGVTPGSPSQPWSLSCNRVTRSSHQ